MTTRKTGPMVSRWRRRIMPLEPFAMGARCLLVVVPFLLASSPAFAQASFTHHPTKNPYRNLFAARPLERKPPPAAAPVAACGIRALPADPSIGPKIFVGPKADGIEHRMRSLTPPACKPE